MPISLEPDKRFPIVLEIDKDKPVESQPTFYANSQSMRVSELITQEFDGIFVDVEGPEELHKRTCEMLHKYIVGWKNMGSFEFPATADEWHHSDVVTWGEASELLRKVIANRDLTSSEKKS